MNSRIKAYVRIRPFLLNEEKRKVWDFLPNKKEISENNSEKIKQNNFDYIFDEESSNVEVYLNAINPIVKNSMEGFNGTVFAFGQTASGKTHTIFGHNNERGVAYYLLENLFQNLNCKSHFNGVMLVSFIEIYNENIFDLLSSDNNKNLTIAENFGNFYIEGAKEKIVDNIEDAYNVLLIGKQRKTMGNSFLHDKSSRSHTIFRILVGRENTYTKVFPYLIFFTNIFLE